MTKRTYGGPLIDMAGAVDLHCHPYPDLFPRLADDFDIVRGARDAGMKAIMLKCHHENTVSRAYLVQRIIPGIRVFGGIVLNYYVGKVTRMITDNPLQLLDVDADYEPSPADLAWARGLVEDPCASVPVAPSAPAPVPAAPPAGGPG